MKNPTRTRYTQSGIDCSFLAKMPPVKSLRHAVDFVIIKGATSSRNVANGIVRSSLHRQIAKDGGMLLRATANGEFVGCGEISDEPDYARPLVSLSLDPFNSAPAVYWDKDGGLEKNDVLRWIRDTFDIKTEKGCRFMLGRATHAGLVHFDDGMLCLGPGKKMESAEKAVGRPKLDVQGIEAIIRGEGKVTRGNAAKLASLAGCSERSIWSVWKCCKKEALTAS